MVQTFEVTGAHALLIAIVLILLGFVLGYLVARSGYRTRYHSELESFRKTVNQLNQEKQHLIKNEKREIAKAVTNEWNRGYSAAWNRLKQMYLYIHQWEVSHGMDEGELESVVQQFENIEEDNANE